MGRFTSQRWSPPFFAYGPWMASWSPWTFGCENGERLSVSTIFQVTSRWTIEVTCSLQDRKSTRLNSSHDQISYAVFCLKKKTKDSIGVTPGTTSYKSFYGAAPHLLPLRASARVTDE